MTNPDSFSNIRRVYSEHGPGRPLHPVSTGEKAFHQMLHRMGSPGDDTHPDFEAARRMFMEVGIETARNLDARNLQYDNGSPEHRLLAAYVGLSESHIEIHSYAQKFARDTLAAAFAAKVMQDVGTQPDVCLWLKELLIDRIRNGD